jgi:uncharacterized phosphosugar-binding protein
MRFDFYVPPIMKPSSVYLSRCRQLIEVVESQQSAMDRAADWFSETILAGRMVHLFGSGHSRILVEEMWPRYGSFPGFNPIVELSLSFHNLVVGANGQRQAMFLENVPGLAERILVQRLRTRGFFEWMQFGPHRNGRAV